MARSVQQTLFDDNPNDTEVSEVALASKWDQDIVKRALDELFDLARKYRGSKEFMELMNFATCFHFYSPFNAILINVQMSGASFVAPPHRWLRDYQRLIKPAAHPLVILQPMGPVMFVFDVSDTEPMEGAKPLPPEVINPFEARKGHINNEFPLLIDNAKRDGVRYNESQDGSQSAGSIRSIAVNLQTTQEFQDGFDEHHQPVIKRIPIRYDLKVNAKQGREARFASVAHELAHLYCGHIGTPNELWWPNRRWLGHEEEEFEAESAAYLVCARLGIDNPSEQYLAHYFEKHDQVPKISLECVMKAAGLIETMSHQRIRARKPMKDDRQT